MIDLWKKITEVKAKRQAAALCVVVSAKGSTPRKPSSKLLVVENGDLYGTVGGGELEYQTIEFAKEVIRTAQPQLFTFNLSKDLKMACGGQVQVYIEPILPNNQLIIFGGGHVGKALARFACHLDFDLIVVEPRKEVINSWELKENIKFVIDDYITAIEKLHFDNKTYICSMTYGHEYDLKIAAECLKRNFAYLGVLASRNKARKFAKILSEDYGFSSELIDNIDMPMGIPIECETPEEIAVSILAKLVDVKNKLKLNDKAG